jgi:hypothetical protein
MAEPRIQNQPANLEMNDFKQYADSYGGLVRSCRFAVRILLPGGNVMRLINGYSTFTNDLTYLCEAAEIPGRGFMNVDLRYYGPNFKLPYQTAYEDITLTFICRAQSLERQFFDDWMEMINPTNSFDFRYRSEYSCEIQLFQFGEADNNRLDERNLAPKAEYLITLADAWPILVNPQPVTWADDNFLRLGVTFTYTKWYRLRDGTPKPYNAPDYDLVKGRTYRDTSRFSG